MIVTSVHPIVHPLPSAHQPLLLLAVCLLHHHHQSTSYSPSRGIKLASPQMDEKTEQEGTAEKQRETGKKKKEKRVERKKIDEVFVALWAFVRTCVWGCVCVTVPAVLVPAMSLREKEREKCAACLCFLA